jgi:Na+:H+ antiporter, NhaA family
MVLRRPISIIAEFLRLEAAAGLLIMASAVLALALANSSAAPSYGAALAYAIGLPPAKLPLSLWINDGLMALFFLLVGLEIKRELLVGELSSVKRAVLPASAAVGGMVLPALIYAAINWHDSATLRGWAIPAATDIAFALSILATLGKRVPVSLKVFLTALAIIDDLGAIIIIALFYTAKISFPALASAAGGMMLLFAFNRLKIRRLTPYLLVGLFVWCAVMASGIHATLAGIAVALMIPLRGADAAEENSPLHRLEHSLHPWVAYGILPIFALANAGLSFQGLSPAALLSPVPLGIAAGLFFGKQIGVLSGSWLTVKCGWAEWPHSATGTQIYGIALICGIGFTMSLFIGGLAFSSDELQRLVKLGVFSVSVFTAIVGYLTLRFAGRRLA